MGADLYKSLNNYFSTHLQDVRKASDSPLSPMSIESLVFAFQRAENLRDDELLKFYTTEWARYTTGAQYVNRLFTYLNRHWIKREKDEGRKGVYPVYTVRTLVYPPGIIHDVNMPAGPRFMARSLFPSHSIQQ